MTRSVRGKLLWKVVLLLMAGTLGATVAEAECVDVTLTTQAEVDAFSCTVVTGSLWIRDPKGTNNDPITNLNGLSALTSVGGNLAVYSCDALTNVDGLSGVTSVGGYLDIEGCDVLTNVDGLSGITSVGGTLEIADMPKLVNVDGLSGITSVGSDLGIALCDALTDLDGLSGITSVGGNLYVWGNGALECFCGLYPLLSADGLDGSYNVEGRTEQQILDGGPCDPADLVQDLLDEGVINAGQAKALTRLVEKSSKGLAGALAGWVKAGILTQTQAQLIVAIANA